MPHRNRAADGERHDAVGILAASRSMRLRASHPSQRPVARNAMRSTSRLELTMLVLKMPLALSSSGQAETNLTAEAINRSRAIRFTHCRSLAVALGGFTRAELMANEAMLSKTAKLHAGTTSLA